MALVEIYLGTCYIAYYGRRWRNTVTLKLFIHIMVFCSTLAFGVFVTLVLLCFYGQCCYYSKNRLIKAAQNWVIDYYSFYFSFHHGLVDLNCYCRYIRTSFLSVEEEVTAHVELKRKYAFFRLSCLEFKTFYLRFASQILCLCWRSVPFHMGRNWTTRILWLRHWQ